MTKSKKDDYTVSAQKSDGTWTEPISEEAFINKAKKLTEVKGNINDEKREIKCKEFLVYKFSPDELKDMSEDMARNYQEQIAIENEKKTTMAEFTAKIEGKKTVIESLAQKITNKQEHRHIECVIKMNTPVNTKKTLTRIDTGEVVWEKNMTSEEMQLKLSLENENGLSDAMVVHNDGK